MGMELTCPFCWSNEFDRVTQIHYYETFTACVKRCIAAGLDEDEEARKKDEENAKMYSQEHTLTHPCVLTYGLN